MNLLEIDCSALNMKLQEILFDLRSMVCEHFLEEIRTNNREVCASFDEIAERISGTYIFHQMD